MTSVFGLLAGVIAFTGFRVVTSRNVMHSALYLVGTLGATAGLFMLLSAEFVAWALIMVYIGAVVVLFLFGVMITRAPMGREASLDQEERGLRCCYSGIAVRVAGWHLVMRSKTYTSVASEKPSTRLR